MKIEEIMETDFITINSTQTVREVANILTENGIDGAPVVDEDDELLGIITGGDLLSKHNAEPSSFIHFLDNVFYMGEPDDFAEDFGDTLTTKIENIMTEDVITLKSKDSVYRAANIFAEKGIKQIPVVENGKVIAIVRVADLIAVMDQD